MYYIIVNRDEPKQGEAEMKKIREWTKVIAIAIVGVALIAVLGKLSGTLIANTIIESKQNRVISIEITF
ncbi:hypothetical protein LCGC14_2601130 [marine sediment metagenome]|uniref:Uncharacterized protein n=1 Tax=marine sediment metagenome TaxID=412755 RepID=A0A0F9A8N2_9ZZZZ